MIWLGVENTQWTQAAADRLFRLRTPYHVDGGPWNVPSRWCRRRPSSDGSGAGDGPSDGRGTLPAVFPSPEPPCRSSTPWQWGAENDSNGPIV